ncbi:MAG: EF2563 family selenium-dependent molybdenum hydroxylase system protein [Clostridia bacterium]|nr:EF2563 family selenium-dependent molybdenum hydroxylase system protein [Clostridia bacterium]
MLVVIKGAGDLASGIAVRLAHCGFQIVMTDLDKPTSIRRTVCFSEAIRNGSYRVEDVTGTLAASLREIPAILARKEVAVLVDPEANCVSELLPDAVVDAILAKRNLGTRIDDAPIVIGVGPGFTAGADCHAVVETQRGHNLGRVITTGSAAPNSGIPGNISGFTTERILRAPCDGIFTEVHHIGDTVEKGEIVATVEGQPIQAQIRGTIRGLLPTGTIVCSGMKSGDVDPRCCMDNCYTVSDKARAVGGGVLEAILMLREANHVSENG